jgi:hypothetical protein
VAFFVFDAFVRHFLSFPKVALSTYSITDDEEGQTEYPGVAE